MDPEMLRMAIEIATIRAKTVVTDFKTETEKLEKFRKSRKQNIHQKWSEVILA
jgi:hypothetical protein